LHDDIDHDRSGSEEQSSLDDISTEEDSSSTEDHSEVDDSKIVEQGDRVSSDGDTSDDHDISKTQRRKRKEPIRYGDWLFDASLLCRQLNSLLNSLWASCGQRTAGRGPGETEKERTQSPLLGITKEAQELLVEEAYSMLWKHIL
jgi:hypothetical protein